MKKKQKKYVGQQLNIGYQLIGSCIEDLLMGLTYSACTLTRLKNSWPSCMREYVAIMWEDVR